MSFWKSIKEIFIPSKSRVVPSSIIIETGVSQTKNKLAMSKYSEFPRYYTINGTRYDIDNPKDIQRIPLIKNIMFINGKPYGMDTILFEHYRQCPDRDLGYVAYDKCQEFRKNGIINKSDWEIELDARYEARQKKEDARKKQCDAFTVDDMQHFPDIPIAWRYIMELKHTNGIAWCQLNRNNQKIALSYISQINDIILDAQEYVEGIGEFGIALDKIDFDYPNPMRMDSMCNTRIECYPYTRPESCLNSPLSLLLLRDLTILDCVQSGKLRFFAMVI